MFLSARNLFVKKRKKINRLEIVRIASINTNTFDRKNSFPQFTNKTLESVKQLPRERLVSLQTDYYNMMLNKETKLLFGLTPRDRDETVTYESRKRGADNSLQFDRIMKSSKASSPFQPKKLHGTAYFKQRGCFEQVSVDTGTRNNCPKANIPTLTVFFVINLRQTQKDIEKDVMNYVDMKMLAQINRIKNPSGKKIEEDKNKNPNSDSVYCTFPVYEGVKLRGITEQICMITVLGNQGAIFFDK